MAKHDDVALGHIHIGYNWSYADATARGGATGFVASDLGKFARQLDDNTIWILTATTPTWVIVGSGGVPGGAAGGDLTGTYPNPSVVNDSHEHTFTSIPHDAHGNVSGVTADQHHDKAHIHNTIDGTPKLTQADTHESADTDAGASSLHHTIGSGANNAAAGNHSHGATGHAIKDEGGAALTARTNLNFVGTGVAATDDSQNDATVVTIPGKHAIQDEGGTPLTARSKLNFAGAGVTATDDSQNDATLITIPGASGGHTIKDEGGAGLTTRANLNFVGAGVAATDDSQNDATVVTIPGKHVVQDEGTVKTARTNLNFAGAGVTVTDDSGNDATLVTIPGASGSGGHTIEDNGTPVTARTKLNFAGAGVIVTDDNGNDATVITIGGGGGGSSLVKAISGGNLDLVPAGTVTAIGSTSPHTQDLICDGSTGTYWQWQSGAGGSWIQVDFGAQKTFNKVRIYTIVVSGDTLGVWKLEGSNNGSAWTEIATSQTAPTYDAWTEYTYSAQTWRYVRVTQQSNMWPVICELQVLACGIGVFGLLPGLSVKSYDGSDALLDTVVVGVPDTHIVIGIGSATTGYIKVFDVNDTTVLATSATQSLAAGDVYIYRD